MRATRSARQFWYATVVLALSVGLAIGAMFGVIWWQERPLAAAADHLESGELEAAARMVEAFLAEHPRHDRALALQARLLVATGQPERALTLFDQVGAANDQELHAWATALLQLQNWSGALPILEHLLRLHPRDPDVLHEITACRTKLGQHRAALESAEALAQLPGLEARGYLLLGTIHYNTDNDESAAEAWGRVLEYEPDAENLQVPADEFFLEYGNALLRSGRPDAALQALQRSIAIMPSADAYILSAQANLALGRAEQATADWATAIEREPQNPIAREGLARAALERGDPAAAVKLLEPVSSAPRLRSSTAYLLQRGYALLGDAAAAGEWQQRKEELQKQEQLEDTLDQLLIESPESFWADVVRAYRFAQAGNWRQAHAITTGLLKTSPESPFVRELAEAVERRDSLPPLDQIPIPQRY